MGGEWKWLRIWQDLVLAVWNLWIMLPQGKCLVNKELDQTVADLSESASLPQISLLSRKKYYRKHFEN